MKSLVVYDSNFGNTKLIAETIANELHTIALSVKDTSKTDLKDIELLIVGSPINGWRPTQKIIDWLHTLTKAQMNDVNAAGFDTRITKFFHGDAAGKITTMLKRAGANIVNNPKGFFVEGKEGPLLKGEQAKAKEWAKILITQSISQKKVLTA